MGLFSKLRDYNIEYTFRNNVEVNVEDGKITVTRKDDSKVSKQLHGTTNSNINNMLIGVSEGFKKELEIKRELTTNLKDEYQRLYEYVNLLEKRNNSRRRGIKHWYTCIF